MSGKRILTLFTLTIATPTVLVLALGLRAVGDQRRAIRSLTSSNLLLSQERLAHEFERRTIQLALAALLDRRPETHAIVQFYFRLEDGVVIDPRLHPREAGLEPPPDPLRSAWLQAERDEQSQPTVALSLYRQCVNKATSRVWKARAIARIVRCLRSLEQTTEAQAALARLAAEYSDQTDSFGRPYALIAAFENGWSSASVYEDLIRGRWDLDAETIDYYAAKLDRASDTPYVRRARAALAFEANFRPSISMSAGIAYPYAFESEQVVVTPIGATTLAAIVVDPNFARNKLFPQCRSELGLSDQFHLVGRNETNATAFKSIFPAWGLSIENPPVSEKGLPIFSAVTAIALSVLCLGAFLLWRDANRETELNQLRADLVSGVTHDLKTPVTVIQLYADTLLKANLLEPVERDSFLKTISRESERLGRMVDNVLDYARIDRRQKSYSLDSVDLNQLVGEVVEGYASTWSSLGFQVETRLANGAPKLILDYNAISQALLNLLDNAVKHSDGGRCICVSVASSAKSVFVEVKDHGAGIPLAERKKIFERFYRGVNRPCKGGYGLGLYLVRHIMDAHGGSVEVESEVGKGSLFRLVFPICPKS